MIETAWTAYCDHYHRPLSEALLGWWPELGPIALVAPLCLPYVIAIPAIMFAGWLADRPKGCC